MPAGAPQELTKYTIDVSDAVDGLEGKHAIFLVAEGPRAAREISCASFRDSDSAPRMILLSVL